MTAEVLQANAGLSASATAAEKSIPIPTKNNMDALRLFFASLVVFAHCYDLTLNPALRLVRDWANSTAAVQGFFILSGFLVVMSYERSRTLPSYFNKRFRRIYPAYFTIIIICSILGVFLTRLSLKDYFSADLAKYILANLVFLNFIKPNLPGVFDNNVLNAVNGALWTIKIEVAFYFSVPFICYSARRIGVFPTLATIYILSFGYLYFFDYMHETTNKNIYDLIGKFLPGQMMYFISGSALYYHFGYLYKNRGAVLLIGLVLTALAWWTGFAPIEPIGYAMLVFGVAFGPYLGNIAKYGDFSYGIYISHFPIVQTMTMLGAFSAAPLFSTAAAYALAFVSAILSWNLIEKPWLSRSNHYVKTTEDAPKPA